MSKYIDADRIDWRVIIPTNPITEEENMIYHARKLIELQPTADVVEVVRCKDCENWDTHWTSSTFRPNAHYCCVLDNAFDGEFFCACGERRKN